MPRSAMSSSALRRLGTASACRVRELGPPLGVVHGTDHGGDGEALGNWWGKRDTCRGFEEGSARSNTFVLGASHRARGRKVAQSAIHCWREASSRLHLHGERNVFDAERGSRACRGRSVRRSREEARVRGTEDGAVECTQQIGVWPMTARTIIEVAREALTVSMCSKMEPGGRGTVGEGRARPSSSLSNRGLRAVVDMVSAPALYSSFPRRSCRRRGWVADAARVESATMS